MQRLEFDDEELERVDALDTKPAHELLAALPPSQALELDLVKFERLRAGGRPHQALALWRRPAYDDLAYEPCVQAERARLEELRVVTLESASMPTSPPAGTWTSSVSWIA